MFIFNIKEVEREIEHSGFIYLNQEKFHICSTQWCVPRIMTRNHVTETY